MDIYLQQTPQSQHTLHPVGNSFFSNSNPTPKSQDPPLSPTTSINQPNHQSSSQNNLASHPPSTEKTNTQSAQQTAQNPLSTEKTNPPSNPQSPQIPQNNPQSTEKTNPPSAEKTNPTNNLQSPQNPPQNVSHNNPPAHPPSTSQPSQVTSSSPPPITIIPVKPDMLRGWLKKFGKNLKKQTSPFLISGNFR